jgi:hypothetical protein
MKTQFSGMKLDPEQKEMIERLGDKLAADLEVESLHVNTKAHRKAGNRYSYTTQLRAELNGKIFSSKSQDWDFKKTVHESFKKLTKEIKSKRKGFISRIFRRIR